MYGTYDITLTDDRGQVIQSWRLTDVLIDADKGGFTAINKKGQIVLHLIPSRNVTLLAVRREEAR